MSNILGLIPARGGSKAIPHKNIRNLAGRPMLAHTGEAALGSYLITRVVLSTDDESIANVGRECGLDVPFLRPPELAQDDSPSLEVAQHAIGWLKENEDYKVDILVLLQPTSPLRRADHIDAALEKMLQTDADTIVSVIAVPHMYHPYAIMSLQDGRLHEFWSESVPFDRYQRQNLPTLYARNGPAILATKAKTLGIRDSFYGERVVPYVMAWKDSLDIDTPFDLRLAEWHMQEREKLAN